MRKVKKKSIVDKISETLEEKKTDTKKKTLKINYYDDDKSKIKSKISSKKKDKEHSNDKKKTINEKNDFVKTKDKDYVVEDDFISDDINEDTISDDEIEKKDLLKDDDFLEVKNENVEDEDDFDMSKKNKNKKKNNFVKAKDKNVKKKNEKKKKKRSFWKKLITAFLILCILGVLAVATFLGYIVLTAPKFDESKFNVHDQTVVYDINGNIMATLGTEKRETVTYDQLPQVLIDAIIATEDSRFFQHNGVDLPRFLKASLLQLLGRNYAGGASTLTMQIVKNNLTSKTSSGIKGIIRKFQDVYLAVFKVEKEYSKEEIIELYVNNYNLGSNIYGVQEASKYYFGKTVSELTLPEASLIAGLFQAPNRHNPYKDIESATARRNTVLNLMKRHGYITADEAELAKSISIDSLLAGISDDSTKYQGFIDVVADEVEELTGDNPYTVAMKIYTTMEPSIQNGINGVLNGQGFTWKNDTIQAGIAVINVDTGAIAAIGAGRNRSGARTFNYATGAYRQPGSTAKPIFDYGPGIEYNNFSTYTLFYDEPWSYTNGPSINNWDGGFNGLMTAKTALSTSRNIPALKAFQQVGAKNSQKFAYSLGLDVSLNSSSENYRVLSSGVDNAINQAYSIGGVAEGFTPLSMAAAYAGFASGGYYTKPYTVTKIEYRDTGEVEEFKPTKTRVMKDSTAYLINNILEYAVTSGNGPGGARVPGSHVAAKTGTSNYNEATMQKYHLPDYAVNDLWTIAYTSQYSVGLWYGYKEVSETTYNINNNEKNVLMSAIIQHIPKDTKGWTPPSSVVASAVEIGTWPAQLPSAYTPSDMVTTEYFVKGTQPTEVSERYAKLNNVDGLDYSKNGSTATITWNFTPPRVLTDDYLKTYFSQSVFGNSSGAALSARKSYNNDVLGGVGFAIYKVENDGSQTLIGFTKDKKFNYRGFGNTTLIVKTEYANYKSNASSGEKITIPFDDAPNEDLIATLNGLSSISVTAKTYSEPGVKSVYYGTQNVTNDATIKYQLVTNNSPEIYTSTTDLEKAINLKPAGTYKITYVISYEDKEITKERTVTIR